MARNKKVEILSNDKEVLHPMTDGDCVIFEDGQTLTQKLSEDDSVKYTPEIVNSSPMFKVGEGNTVDYSDNVLDGAYERATLQGQTYVNYIQESSADEVTLPTPFTEYERTQHNTLTSDEEEGTLGINLVGQSYVNALQHDSEEEFVVLGESLEFQEKKVEYTNEGQIKSAILKGNTLVNLRKATRPSFQKSSTMDIEVNYQELNGMGVTINSCVENSWGYISCDIVQDAIKPSTKYLVKGSFKNVTKIGLQLGNGAVKWSRLTSVVDDSYVIITTLDTLGTVPTTDKIILYIDVLKESGVVCEALDIVLLEYQEGMENWHIPYFEGMQSVTVSTRLENKLGTFSGTVSTSKTGKTFTTTDGMSRSLYLYGTETVSTNPINLKPNTKYLIQFAISNLVLDGLAGMNLIWSDSTLESGNCLFGENTGVRISANGTYRTILTTTDLIATSSFVVKGYRGDWEGSGSSLRSLTISNIMCIEYQNGMENWNLPYFEDYQVMKPVQVESTSKNLASVNTFQLTSQSDSSTGSAIAILNKVIEVNIPLNPSLEYVFTSDNTHITALCTNEPIPHSAYQHGHNSCYTYAMATGGKEYKYPNNLVSGYKYITITTGGANGHYDVGQTVTFNNIQLEESSTATSYVPHQSKTTYSWDEVILRKVGDVEDTLDLTTGEWVQRIGEIVLDGSEDWMSSTATDSEGFATYQICMDTEIYWVSSINQDSVLKSDKLPTTTFDDGSKVGIFFDGWGLYVRLQTSSTREDFIACLKSNPIKVQYVLKKPIVHKVNLSRPNLQVYDDITHIHTKCLDGTLVPNIYLPSDISYPAILEPGKKYNVCVNQTEVSTDNPLKVNVGGTEITMTDSRMTLTTPATLANSNVSFTGKGNKIKESMLIKNSSLLTRDLPHFNGIGSVQLGKTIENLCGALSYGVGTATFTEVQYNDKIVVTVTKQGSLVYAFELTRQLENGKQYYVYVPNTYPTNYQGIVGFRKMYNGTLTFAAGAPSDGVQKSSIIEINQTDNPYTHLTFGRHGGDLPANTVIELQRPIICEYEPGMENWDWESIGYFTGTKNIGNEFMRVQNKNLFDGIVERGTIAMDTGIPHYNDKEIRTKNFIKVQPGSTITISRSLTETTTACRWYDKDKNYLAITLGLGSVVQPKTSATCVVPKNAHYLKLKDMCVDANGLGDLSQTYQIEESSTATSYTAHKHNGLYITKDQPINLTWEQGNVDAGANTSWNDAIQNTISKRIRTKLITLKPNTSYRVSLGNKDYMWYLYAFDGNNVCPQPHSFNMKPNGFMQTDFIFTTTQQLYKIALVGRKVDDTPITPSESVHAQVRLEEVTDVILRGIGDVRDELDITRGKYIQRIDEIVYDGSQDEQWHTQTVSAGSAFCVDWYGNGIYHNNPNSSSAIATFINNRYVNLNVYLENGNGITLHSYNNYSKNGVIYLRTDDGGVASLRESLQSKPIILQYRLAEPIEHDIVFIGNKNEANTEVTKPNGVFTLPTLYTEQTHIDLTNNGIVPKVQSRDYIAYPVTPMINRTYTLQHNLTGGVSNLTIDLLGRTQQITYQNHKSLVYTPETMDALLHDELRISGKGKISGVMYIDGGYMDRDIPYIEGMKNAVNPIVKNVGKNLISFDNMYSYHITNGSLSCVNNTITRLKDGYNDMQLYIYLVNGKHYYFGLDGSIGVGGVQQPKIILGKMRGWEGLPEQQKIAPNQDFIYRGQTGWVTLHMVNIDYINDIYITEVQSHENCEPYKENICYVDCGEIRLTSDMFEQGNIVYNNVNAGTTYESMKQESHIRIRTKELIKIKPNTKYLLNVKGGYRVFVREFDVNKGKLNDSALSLIDFQSRGVFTTNANTQYISLLIGNLSDTSLPLSDFDKFNLLLIENDDMVILRSLPNGVRDELNLQTGEYIQRVGEMTLNDNDYIIDYFAAESTNEYSLFAFVRNDIKNAINEDDKTQALCDKLPYEHIWKDKDREGFFISNDRHRIFIRISNNKLSGQSVDALNEYLASNPIKAQYVLDTPIIKHVDIHNYPHSYEGGHVIIESGDPNTPITAQLTYRAVTNRSGQIQQHTEQVEKQEREINELETLILANIHLSQTR